MNGEYLTNSNEIFRYNYDSKKYEKVGENVKEYHNKYYYITNSNAVYLYNYESNEYEKVGENIKKYYNSYYITISNELYVLNGESNKYEKLNIDLNNIKEFGRDYFITKDGKIRVWYKLKELPEPTDDLTEQKEKSAES